MTPVKRSKTVDSQPWWRGEALRSRFWQNYRSGLRRTRGQISERTCLDVASASARARESSGSLAASLCALAQPRDRALPLDHKYVVPIGIAHESTFGKSRFILRH